MKNYLSIMEYIVYLQLTLIKNPIKEYFEPTKRITFFILLDDKNS